MQNSYGKLEHSNLKCSPIFQKSNNQNLKKEEETTNQNFSFHSMNRNKSTRTRNLEGVGMTDLMTPVRRGEENKDNRDSILTNNEEQDKCDNMNEKNLPLGIFSRKSSSGSAFLLNYGDNNVSKANLSAQSSFVKPSYTPFKSVNCQIINQNESNFKPMSSIFGHKNPGTLNSSFSTSNPFEKSTDSSSSNAVLIKCDNNQAQDIFQSPVKTHLKIREIIKQSDYEKQFQKNKIDNDEDKLNKIHLEEINIESSFSEESEEVSSVDICDQDIFKRQSAFMQKNFSNNFKSNSQNYTEENYKNKTSSSKSIQEKYYENYDNNNFVSSSPIYREFLNNKRYCAPRKSADCKIKSIKNIVDSTLSKKQKEKNKKYNNDCKEDFENFKLKNIKANKYTIKIWEESHNKSQNDDNYNNFNNYNYSKTKIVEKKILSKNKKLKSKKQDITKKAEIHMIQKDPITFQEIEYLLKEIPETPEMNHTCSFMNNELKNDYVQYLKNGKPNEIRLSFGRNPLIIYQELTDWLLKEKRKLDEGAIYEEESSNTKDFCSKIIEEMNEISHITSILPVICSEEPSNRKKKKKE